MPQRMPPIVPQRRPANDSPSDPTPPAEKPSSSDPTLGSYAQRIRSALALIDEHPDTKSQFRAMLGGYYRCISCPRVDLPRSLREHATHKTHGTECGPWLTFYYHLGAAIKAYHAALLPASDVVDVRDNLISRIALLEQLVAAGPHNWNVCGGEADGFWLEVRK